MDTAHFKNVRGLWLEVCSRNPPVGSSHQAPLKGNSTDQSSDEVDLVDQDTINAQQELEKDRIESSNITVNSGIVKMHVSATIDFHNRSRMDARSTSLKRSPDKLRAHIELLQGVYTARVHFHSRNRLRTYATEWLPLYILYRDLNDRFPDVSVLKQAIIHAQIKSHGEEHPHKWACDALENDPACRLGFWVLLIAADGQQLGLYASCEGERAAKRANTFVDWMAEIPAEEIATKPRRSITFQINSPMMYTDNQGNVIPREGKKRKQEELLEGEVAS